MSHLLYASWFTAWVGRAFPVRSKPRIRVALKIRRINRCDATDGQDHDQGQDRAQAGVPVRSPLQELHGSTVADRDPRNSRELEARQSLFTVKSSSAGICCPRIHSLHSRSNSGRCDKKREAGENTCKAADLVPPSSADVVTREGDPVFQRKSKPEREAGAHWILRGG